MPKFTKRFVESIVPDPQKMIKHWDSELKGFGLIVLPSGRRTYCVQYRNAQRVQKMFKIGVHGQVTTEEARVLAKKYLSGVVHGHDPVKVKKESRDLPTLNELARDYVLFHGGKKQPKSLKEDQRLLKTIILPALGTSLVAKISRRDVEALHRDHQKTSYQANRVISVLSKMFTLANTWGWCEDNPAKGVQRYQEEKRKRWLAADELKVLWKVLDEYSNQHTAALFRLLILTGARSGELLPSTWDQFNLEASVWTKPSRLTKQREEEHVPLSPQAIEIVRAMQSQSTSPFLFPGKVEGKPLQEVKTAWNTIRKKSGFLDLRIHDLRHTYASHLVSSGLSLSIIGKLLGHTQASTTQRYAHLADEPLRQATELFGSNLDKIIGKER
ncbi:MAG: tyrosine-type recombinase/integrase [Alphaproteobacteria bacterium]|nr:tyrosine-type recombinase/integrase [Alphaproteobacteria bacterium]